MSNSIYNHPNYGPIFGGGFDICIANKSNSNKNSYSNFTSSYGKNEGANLRDLTKE
jgi:hypothetical protein